MAKDHQAPTRKPLNYTVFLIMATVNQTLKV